MHRFFRKLTSRIILLANLLVVLLFLLASITPYLNPAKWWFTGFLSLLFPFILFAVILFALFWLFFNPRLSIYSAIALLLGICSISKFIALNKKQDFRIEKNNNQIRVMTWNVRYFVPFEKPIFQSNEIGSRDNIFKEIKLFQPDIICFQEFFTNGGFKGIDNVLLLSKELGYPYHFFSRDNIHWGTVVSGTAIFSRYPMINATLIPFPKDINSDGETTISTDIIFRDDTLRIFNMHLQSFKFLPQDYASFGKIKNQQDTGLVASKKIIRKMKSTFSLHSKQADFIADKIKESTYPAILCGDMNDVPNSYAYAKIREKRKDAFLEKGFGFGKTFTSSTSRVMGMLPTLRIDYIFTDPKIETSQFTQITKKLSDHQPLVADLNLKEKK
ncbi:MAG: endonuclease/exonuclease/phosphatase family protein [Chitinophagaceae bacterium]